MKKMFLALFVVSILFVSQSAHADLFWDWDYIDLQNAVYGNTDDVSLSIMFYNNSTNGETIGNFGSGADGEITSVLVSGVFNYSFPTNPDNLITTPLQMAAGTSKVFTWTTYKPVVDNLNQIVPVPDGNYSSNGKIWVTKTDGHLMANIRKDFNWSVGATSCDPTNGNCGDGTNAVPEPATMVLFASGLIGAFVRKIRKA